MKKLVLDHHIIYGEWDDVIDYQFMVHYPKGGDMCTVFLFSGMDYGGGISKVIKIKTSILNEYLDKYSESPYLVKKAIREDSRGEVQ